MKIEGPVRIEHILAAFREFRGEADAGRVKDRVIANRGGTHGYKSDQGCRKIIQRLIENHCPQRSSFKGKALFESLGHGRYRLIGT